MALAPGARLPAEIVIYGLPCGAAQPVLPAGLYSDALLLKLSSTNETGPLMALVPGLVIVIPWANRAVLKL